MLTVHLRINDAATGKPTPVRLSVTGPDGAYYAPLGRLTEFATGRNEDVGGHLRLGGQRFCYIDGSCEIRLPAGVPLTVRATKGPEYEPLTSEVVLGTGQMALRFAIKRRSDLRAEGWYSGDTRVHTMPPHTAALEAAAEDVAVVNLLARVQPIAGINGTVYPSIPNITAFSGQQIALYYGDVMVAVNTLNVHPVLGSVGLLHSHRVVYPLTFGGPDDTDDWSVCDWCDQCHRKNGLTVWANPFEADGGEALVALVLGKIDAVEYDGRPRKVPFLPTWYRLLNAGFRVPIVGGSGKDSNAVALGSPRTYAWLPVGEAFNYANWINAVRAGRTFATTGPLVGLEVAGRAPGEVLTLPAGEHNLPVKVTGPGVELVVNGEALVPAESLTVRESCWVAARVLDRMSGEFAHTSPVCVFVEGSYRPVRVEYLRQIAASVQRTREWVELHGRFADPKSKVHLLELCDTALAMLSPETPP